MSSGLTSSSVGLDACMIFAMCPRVWESSLPVGKSATATALLWVSSHSPRHCGAMPRVLLAWGGGVSGRRLVAAL